MVGTARELAHTADIAYELHAPTEEELLEVGARLVVGLLTDGAEVEPRDRREVRLECLDAEDRLVSFLNEVLVVALVDGFVTSATELTLTEDGLEGALLGEANRSEAVVSELKAVTYHDLALEDRGDEWVARVVIDV